MIDSSMTVPEVMALRGVGSGRAEQLLREAKIMAGETLPTRPSNLYRAIVDNLYRHGKVTDIRLLCERLVEDRIFSDTAIAKAQVVLLMNEGNVAADSVSADGWPYGLYLTVQGRELALSGRLGPIEPSEIDPEVERLVAGGLSKSRAYKKLKDERAGELSEGASESLSSHILKVLKNGSVAGVPELQEALSFMLDDHPSSIDVTKAVWSLQKRNLVTFYERKAGRDSILQRIKLTRNGETEMGVRAERHSLKPERVKPTGELKGRSPVGKDLTDAVNHGSRAEGGPIERTNGAERPKQEIIPAVPYEAPAPPRPTVVSDPPRQNERTDLPNVDRAVDLLKIVEAGNYPLLAGIFDRVTKSASYEKAAEALIDVDAAMAEELLSRVKFTALELEVVKLVKAFGS